MASEDTPGGIAAATAPITAATTGVDVIGGISFCASTEALPEGRAEDDQIGIGNDIGSGDDSDANSPPPSDEMVTSAAKLGDEIDAGDADEDEDVDVDVDSDVDVDVDVDAGVVEAIRTMVDQADSGIGPASETIGEQQQLQLQDSFTTSDVNPRDSNMVSSQPETEIAAMMLPSGEEDQSGEEVVDTFTGASSAGDDSGDNSNTMDDDDDDDDGKVACQIVVAATTTTPFDAGAIGEGSAMDSMGTNSNSTTPTHHRTNSDNSNRKKRLCRFPGCTRVIKSQGHCQRHGAKAKRCKVEGCEKQAQGTHNGMCKRHWRAVHFPDQIAAKAEAARKKELEEKPPPPYGESVYDNVLPASIAYRPSFASHLQQQTQLVKTAANSNGNITPTDMATPMIGVAAGSNITNHNSNNITTNGIATEHHSQNDPKTPQSPSIVSAMPLVTFLRDGALHKDFGWHRQAERRARGIFRCSSLSAQLEPWEKQLALVEILLLSGGTPHANFRDLAHAWGRERGFHQTLASSVCTRRGEVERKKRSDAGTGKKSIGSVAIRVEGLASTAAVEAATVKASTAVFENGPTAAVAGAEMQMQMQMQMPHAHNLQPPQQSPPKRPRPTTAMPTMHHQLPPPPQTAATPNFQTPAMVPWHQQIQHQQQQQQHQQQQHQQQQQQQQLELQPIMNTAIPASNNNNNNNGNGDDGAIIAHDIGVVEAAMRGASNGGYYQE